MAAYSERTVDSFLDASTLKTGFDGYASNVARADEKYRDGLRIGAEYPDGVHVSINDVWGASKLGSNLSSYERLGYHAGTADFWRGILDSGCAITIYRIGPDGKIVRHNLRELAARLAG